MAQCGQMPATKHDHMSSVSRTHGWKGKLKKKNLSLGKGNLSKITDYYKFPIHFENSLQLNYFFYSSLGNCVGKEETLANAISSK